MQIYRQNFLNHLHFDETWQLLIWKVSTKRSINAKQACKSSAKYSQILPKQILPLYAEQRLYESRKWRLLITSYTGLTLVSLRKHWTQTYIPHHRSAANWDNRSRDDLVTQDPSKSGFAHALMNHEKTFPFCIKCHFVLPFVVSSMCISNYFNASYRINYYFAQIFQKVHFDL